MKVGQPKAGASEIGYCTLAGRGGRTQGWYTRASAAAANVLHNFSKLQLITKICNACRQKRISREENTFFNKFLNVIGGENVFGGNVLHRKIYTG